MEELTLMKKLTQEEIENIRKNPDKVDWDNIPCIKVLSEDFIREFSNKVNWYTLVALKKENGKVKYLKRCSIKLKEVQKKEI